MLDEKTREAIALKRFALISPVLNGQVANQKNYFSELCTKPIDMPYYGLKEYAPKTLQYWLSSYLRGGIEVLKPGYRSDRGKSRRIDEVLADKIKEKRAQFKNMPVKLLYETLVGEGLISPDRVSLPTFYRFIEDMNIKNTASFEEKEEIKRFSHEYVNEMWQTDCMYGPYIKDGKSKRQTFLLAYIDDASRLITHAEFYFAQNFETLRISFKEAVLKRGIPKILYTDNGKIYRSGQFGYICASIGCHLVHAKPFMPHQKGKIERFFNTVRMRFLSGLDINSLKTIDDLNLRFKIWLEEDYQRKKHSALNMSPLDFFMAQVSRVKLITDIEQLNENFLLRVSRKVASDATLQVEKILYETEQRFAGMRLEVRYDPEWLKNFSMPILLYHEGKKVGEAYRVNFHDNAHVKRKYGGNRR
ncbi:MAG: DDE-type integrase/transposase/recombinase, partial [Deferribacterales bacterium]|nr:DDE-type integrase/transposase/recombinase [Deferribacterales bacterium]